MHAIAQCYLALYFELLGGNESYTPFLILHMATRRRHTCMYYPHRHPPTRSHATSSHQFKAQTEGRQDSNPNSKREKNTKRAEKRWMDGWMDGRRIHIAAHRQRHRRTKYTSDTHRTYVWSPHEYMSVLSCLLEERINHIHGWQEGGRHREQTDRQTDRQTRGREGGREGGRERGRGGTTQ